MHTYRLIVAASLSLSLVLAACSENSSTTSSASSSDVPTWVLTTAPDNAETVLALKASAKEGDEVVLRGRIGGRMEPLTAGSSVFTVVDLQLPHCGQNPGDSCRTPWDYCCETPETIAANSATIQIVDAGGRSLDSSPAEHGFAPLDEVIVIGSVAPRPDDRVLTLRATGVYRVQ